MKTNNTDSYKGGVQGQSSKVSGGLSEAPTAETRSEWFTVPFRTHSRESLPYIILSKERNSNSPRLKGVIAIMQYLGDGLYCEIEVNKARDSIKLVPKSKQTAYSRNIRTEFGSHVQIGGGATLVNDLGMRVGLYKMISANPLVFKWSGVEKRHAPRLSTVGERS